MISLYSLEQYSAAWYGGRTLSSGLATETVLVFDEGNDFRKIRKGSPHGAAHCCFLWLPTISTLRLRAGTCSPYRGEEVDRPWHRKDRQGIVYARLLKLW
jgi:hypothetical protein